jgi:hypothetical protein
MLCLKKDCITNDDDDYYYFSSCNLLHRHGSVTVPYPIARALVINYSYAENSKIKLFTFLCLLRIQMNLNYITSSLLLITLSMYIE